MNSLPTSSSFPASMKEAVAQMRALMREHPISPFSYTVIVATLPGKLPLDMLFQGHVRYGSSNPDYLLRMAKALHKITPDIKVYQFGDTLGMGVGLARVVCPAFVYRVDRWTEYHASDYAWAANAGVGKWISYENKRCIPAGYALPKDWYPLCEQFPNWWGDVNNPQK